MQSRNVQTSAESSLGQIWAFIIGVFGLLAGIIYLAITVWDTGFGWAVLATGCFLSAITLVVLVEWQFRRYSFLGPVHDWFLGLAFFVLQLGLLFGLFQGLELSRDSSNLGTNIIPLLHTVLILAATVGQWFYLRSGRGGTLAWGATVAMPFVTTWFGLGLWRAWAGDVFDFDLEIPIIILCITGVVVATESSRGYLFAGASIASLTTPLFYEAFMGTEGRAASLVILFILLQGLLAVSPRLPKDQIEKASGIVVVTVLFYQFISRMWSINFSAFGLVVWEDNLASMMWFGLLAGYLAPMLMRRTPWMVVGLAIGLALVPTPAAYVTWVLGLILLPVVLWYPERRDWVANGTTIAMGVSFFIFDWTEFLGGGDAELALSVYRYLIPFGLMAAAVAGVAKEKLQGSAVVILFLLITFSAITMIVKNSFMPQVILVVMLGLGAMATQQFRQLESPDIDARRRVSGAQLAAVSITILLTLFGRLDLLRRTSGFSLDGIDWEIALIGLIIYGLFWLGGRKDVDLGHLLIHMAYSSTRIPVYDPQTRTWKSQQVIKAGQKADGEAEDGWGAAARVGLLGPLFLLGYSFFSLTPSALETSWWWPAALLIPIAMVLTELMMPAGRDTRSRSVAVWSMLLFFVPLRFMISEAGVEGWTATSILYDVILIGGPVFMHFWLIFKEKITDAPVTPVEWTLGGLAVFGLLDATGGLALTVLVILICWRGLRHQALFGLTTVPLLLVIKIANLPSGSFLLNLGLEWFEVVGITWILWGTLMYAAILQGWIDRPEQSGRDQFTLGVFRYFLLVFFAAVAAIGGTIMLYDLTAGILPILVVLAGAGYAWQKGVLHIYYAVPGLLWASLWALFDWWEFFSPDELSWAATFVALISAGLFAAALQGILYQNTEMNDDNRKWLQESFFYWAILAAIFSQEATGGYGPVLVAAWFIFRSWRQRWEGLFVWAPALGWFVVSWSLAPELDLSFDLGAWVGTLMAAALLVASFARYEFGWDWDEKKPEGSLVRFDERGEFEIYLGVVATLLFVIGSWVVVFNDWSKVAFIGTMMLFGAGMAVLGFQRDEEWRRGLGLAVLTLGVFTGAFAATNRTWRALWLIVGALMALGIAVLYFSTWQSPSSGGQLKSVPGAKPTPAAGGRRPAGMLVPKAKPESDSEDEVKQAEKWMDDVVAAVEPEVEIPDTTIIDFAGRLNTGEGWLIELPADVLKDVRQTSGTIRGGMPILYWDNWGRPMLGKVEVPGMEEEE